MSEQVANEENQATDNALDSNKDKNKDKNNSKDEDIIFASAKIAAKTEKRIKGARGAFTNNFKGFQLSKGAKPFLFTILVCGLLTSSAFLWKAWKNNQETITKTKDNIVRNTLPALKIISPTPVEVKNDNSQEIALKVQDDVEIIDHSLSAKEAIMQRKLSPNLTNVGQSATNQGAVQLNSTNPELSGVNDSELQNKLKPLRLNPSVAGKITALDYMLTQGTMIDCQLETRMITTQPGMASCYTTRNTYSTNGRVILIDRGSKIIGNYEGGLQQGQARIFVLWSRIETPKGVIVNLDSPGTGPLGESGLGGVIDTHFWERFGGAIMMSLIGDFGQYAVNKSNKNSKEGTTIQFNNTIQGMQQAAVEALRNSINIPPTLYKNQGERISIFVARDLDFTKVYMLKAQ